MWITFYENVDSVYKPLDNFINKGKTGVEAVGKYYKSTKFVKSLSFVDKKL